MSKKILYLGVMFLFMGIVFIRPAFSGMECTGTTYNGVYYKKGQHYYPIKNGVKYDCVACGGCNPISSGESSGSFTPPSGRLSPSQQMAAGIMGAFFSGLFDNMFDDLSAPPDTSYQDALRKQQEEELLKQQEMKKQAMKQWLDSQAEAEAKRLNEEAERRKRGEDILAKASIGSGELRMEPIGGGKLTPFSWDKPRALEPAPSGQYDTAKFTEMERLLCAAYFSKIAESAANSGELERSRFLGSQVDKVMQGFPTEIECKPPKNMSTAMDMKRLGELNQKYTKMATLYKEIMPKIDKLQEIEIKLDEGKKKREDAEQKILELDKPQ